MIINGTNANDQITGTSSADIINAKNGDDTVSAGAGNDLIQGGNGNDNINAGAGNDIIDAGNGNDTVDGGTGNDIVFGGNGNDTLLGGAGNDLISGDNGDDILDGGAGTDLVSGGNGNDILVYRVSENVGSVDIYDGGKGQDTLRLVVTQEFANSASFRSDLAAIQALIARYGSANYVFSSFDLAVVSIEKIEVVIEGSTNHAPVAVADVASVKEDVTTVANGNLLANDTDADAGDTHIVSAVAGGTDNGTTITVVGSYGTLVVTKATGAYTYTLNTSSTSVQALAEGQQATEQFTYTNADNHGGTGSSTLTVTVTGSNDPATITVSGSQDVSVTEAGTVAGDPGASGQLAVHDVDNGEAHFAVPASLVGTYGNFTFNAATGAWTYTLDPVKSDPLAAGQQVTDTLTVTSVDGTASHDIVVSITGTNDAAVIGNPDQHDVTEDGVLTASGTLSISDVDLNQSSLQTAVASAPGNLGTLMIDANGAYSYSVANGLVQYLGQGETRDEVFTVKALDGTTKDVTFTIHGVNDAADIGGPTQHDVTEDGQLTASGQLSISDADQNQSAFQAGEITASGNLGTVTLLADGHYTYSVDNTAIQYLGANEVKTEAFTVTSVDGTTKIISFDIHGAQDAPALNVQDSSGAADSNITLNIAATKIDQNSILSVKIEGVPSSFAVENGAAIGDGSWLVTGDSIQNVVLIPNHAVGSPDPFTLHVTAISDDGVHQAVSTADLLLTVEAGANEINALDIDGYIGGATVFADANNNGILDADEAYTTTRADGSFTLAGGSGPLVSIGGVDISTGLQVAGVLRAPEGSTVITPLTTLIVALVDSTAGGDNPLTADQAMGAVAAAFNLNLSGGIDLRSFDPVPDAVNNDATATAVLAAAIQVQSTIAQVSAVGVEPDAVITAIAGAITTSQTVPNAPIFNLASSDTVESVVALSGVSTAAAATVVEVVAAANDSIQSATNVTELAQAGQVAQGAAADQLAATDFSDPGSVTELTTLYVQQLDQQIQSVVLTPIGNTLFGSLGDDVLSGGGGNDLIDGQDGNDRLGGGDGNDILFGGAGKDYLSGGSGDDILDGGPGFDRAVYTDATGGVTINLAAGTASGAGVGTDTLINIEAAIGSDFDDTFNGAGFTGDAHVPGTPLGFNEFEGKGGNDTIYSNTNSQGAELTRVSYVSATGAVTVDLAAGYAQGDASVGHDTLLGSGFNGAWGSAYNDTILGSNNPMFTAEVYAGFAGNDYIDGRGGFDRVDYNVDPNTTTGITVNLAGGVVTGDSTIGTDTLRGIEAIRGTNFADTYNATGFGSGSVNAGSNGTFNEFTGNGGNDVITGNGFTRLGFNNATAGVSVDFVTGIATGDSSVGTDQFSGVNAVQASMFDDTLLGGATNDTFTGLAGNDYIDGRGGFDVSSYNNIFFITGSITVDMAAGIVTGDASNGTDTLRSIEGIQGTNFDDTYNATGYGTTGANVGNNGTFNQFEGLGGNDQITGNGNTRLIFVNATGGVTINLAGGTATGDGSTGQDSFTGVNSAFGSNFADVYDATGFAGPNANFNSFQGNAGNDIITGNGNTQIQFGNATGGVSVNLTAGTVDGDGSVGHDTITGGVFNVAGSNFNDTIIGSTGNDSLSGNIGNDILDGRAGNDSLNGGAGADTFVYATGGGFDFIQDFVHGQDKLDLTGIYGIYSLADLQSHAVQSGPNTVITFSATEGLTLQNVNLNSLTASDFLFGTPAAPIVGDENANTLVGTANAETISGLGGNDRLQGLGGSDYLDGGLGFDRAVYADATGGVSVNLTAGTASGPGVGTDTLVNIEGAVGSDFADAFDATGFVGDSGIPGAAIGLAEFEGRGGDDIIIGSVNASGEILGRVSYASATAAVTVDIAAGIADGNASVGHDTFSAINAIIGSAYADTLRGSDNPSGTYEQYDARGGDDLIDGRGGYDFASYNNDAATTSGITVNLAAGIVTGDSSVGTDTLRSVEAVRGTNFADTYSAVGFSDVSTNAGSFGTFNNFEGMGGDDTITGNGATRIQYTLALDGVTVDLALGTAHGTAAGDIAQVGTDHFTGVNAVMGSLFGDVITGSGASEVFMGLAGNDQIDGGAGFDTAQYSNLTFVTGGVNVSMASGTVTGDASTGTDSLRSIEGVQGTIFADSYDATGFGQAGALNVGNSGASNNFEGLGGDDVVTGNGSTRLIYGGATGGVTINMSAGTVTGDVSVGHDSFTNVNAVNGSNFADLYDATGFVGPNNSFNIFQGLGGDDQVIGNGNTQIQYGNATTSGVTIYLAAGTASGDGSVGHDTFTGVNQVVGSNFADVYDATGFNSVYGTFNNFMGGAGNDTITGNGDTQITFGNPTGGVVVNLAAGTVDGDASVGHDTIIGGVRAVQGTIFNDILTSGGGDNALFGNAGNDVLDGGAGNDYLSGGTGADTFIFATGDGSDYVQDFLHSDGDKIDLTGVNGVFSLADVQAHATQIGSDTSLDFGGGNTLYLQNVNLGSLTASDFVFGTPIVGDDNPNTLVGTSHNDTIVALGGNDMLEGGDGLDLLDGGLGFDRAVYAAATGGIIVNLAAGTASGPGVGADTLVNIEGAIGSDFADTFNAAGFIGSTGLPGVATGQSEFEGRGGNDIVVGDINALGQIVTRLSYLSATGAVTVDIGAGTADGDASVGHDTFSNVSTIWGSASNDTIYGSDNASFTYETYEGRGGDDYIDGRGGYDQVTYNSDPTTTSGIYVHLAAGTVNGDATVGTDTIRSVEAARGTNFDDTFDATGFGQVGATNVGSSGTFNDFAGAGGNDTVIGNGFTRLNYQIAAWSVSVDLETSAVGTTNSITVAGSATGATEGTDTFTGVNAVQGSTFSDTLLGSSFNNNFTGLGGDDYIDGRGGFDTAIYNSLSTVTGGVTVDMAAGTATGDASIGTDTLRSIEGVQGTGYADTYVATGYGLAGAANIGNNGNFNQFEGLGGDDVITGNGATRVLYGNATGGVSITIGLNGAGTATGDASTGTDSFTGGVNAAIGSNFADSYDASAYNNGYNSFQGNGGNDTITGNGATQVQYSNATSGVVITIGAGGAGSASGDGSVGTDTFTGVNSALGGNFADSYDASGFSGFNSFQGNAGNDTITGNGSTQIQYNNATGAVNVDLAAGTASGDSSVGTDTITGGVNNVLGSNFGDTITGSAGADFLNGNGGNDTINGGGGNDNLNGGFGADTFVYADGGGADFVSDFNRGQGDRINVTGVTGIFSLADIQAHATQQGANTVIDFGGGNTITLANIAVGSLVATDFVFNNTVLGTSGNDTLVGSSQIDGIYGLDGTDRLQGLGGNDLLDGGNGFDRAVYTEATGSVTVDLAAGTASGAGVGSDTLVNIEGAVGGAFNDTFNAAGFTGSSALPGVAAGQSGFEGGGGDDVITGQINALGQSVTRVEYLGASAAVTVDLAAGTGQGTAAGDLANVGHDTFTNALQGVYGSAFNDTIYGSDNANFTYEVFEGRAGDDYIDGRGGYDMAAYNNDPATGTGITVNLATGTVTGDATVGTDTLRNVEAVRGTIFDDVFDTTGYGAPGALNASTTNGSFNDIAGAGGNDSITGNGFTRLNYSSALAAVTVDLETTAGTAITVAGSATGTTEGTDTFTGVNAVQASMFNDTLLGSSFSNTFTPLGGDDFMDGRGGFDTASYNSLNTVTGGIAVAMAAGTVIGDASIGHDTLRNIEGVQGTGYADTYDASGYGVNGALNVSTSNGNFNQFEGLGGDDVVTGNGATRVLYGNATGGVSITIGLNGAGTATGDASTGHDSFTGGVNAAIGSNFADSYDASAYNNGYNSFQGNAGNDTIAGNGATQVQYSNATSGVVITIGAGGAGSASGDGSVGSDTFTGVNSALGGNFADSYDASGFSGFNSFQGNAGNDTITGNGATQIQYNNATGGVNVNLAAGTASGDGSVGTDTITGGVNNVLGSNFGDTITGSAGADFLNGNGGNDTINGGGGNDNLNGGGGNDNFVFISGATAGATIIDFTGNGAAPGDTLEFHGFGLAADGATLTQIGSSNQWLVHSGLDAHEETITINGGVHATDFHFLT